MEKLALSYFYLGEAPSFILNYAFIAMGFALGVYGARKSTFELRRMSYVLLTAIITLPIVCLNFIFTLSQEALTQGWIWKIVGVYLAGMIVAGVVFGIIGAARSRNISGNVGGAFIGLIPILNLYLVFTPQRENGPADTRSKGLRVAANVLGTIALLIIVSANRSLSEVAQQSIMAVSQDIADNEDARNLAVGAYLETATVEDLLREADFSKVFPRQIDSITELTRIHAEGNHLIRNYTVSKDIPYSDKFQGKIRQLICADPGLHLFLEKGASVEEIYSHTDGHEIGRTMVTLDSCA